MTAYAPPPVPPPGWYDDPWNPSMWRWWDGQQWSGTTHPKAPPAPVAPVATPAPPVAVAQATTGAGLVDPYAVRVPPGYPEQPAVRAWSVEPDGTTVLREPHLPGEPWAGPDPVSVRGRRPWGLGDVALGLLTFFVASFAIVFGITLLYVFIEALSVGAENLSIENAEPPLPILLLGVGAASALGFFGTPLLATFRKGRKSMVEDFGLRFTWLDVPMGIGLAIASLGVSVGLSLAWTAVFGEQPQGNTEFIRSEGGAASVVTVLVALVVVGICVPIFEEVFFRGLVLRSLLRRFAGSRLMVPLSVGLSSLLFGLLHVNSLDPSGLVYITTFTAVVGTLYALVAYKTQRLGAAIIGHAGLNSTVVLAAMLLPVVAT